MMLWNLCLCLFSWNAFASALDPLHVLREFDASIAFNREKLIKNKISIVERSFHPKPDFFTIGDITDAAFDFAYIQIKQEKTGQINTLFNQHYHHYYVPVSVLRIPHVCHKDAQRPCEGYEKLISGTTEIVVDAKKLGLESNTFKPQQFFVNLDLLLGREHKDKVIWNDQTGQVPFFGVFYQEEGSPVIIDPATLRFFSQSKGKDYFTFDLCQPEETICVPKEEETARNLKKTSRNKLSCCLF